MTKDEAPELKPCPFCGETPTDANSQGSYVYCHGCKAEGPVKSPSGGKEAWNTRTDIADALLERAVRAALEAAAEVLDRHNSIPCRPACPERWTDERWTAYEAGQVDAAISWQSAIRALDPAQVVKGVKDDRPITGSD